MATVPQDIIDQLKAMTISSSEVKITGESVGREIGRGAYGRVFTVKYCGLICAAKEIHSLLVEGVGHQQLQSVKEGFLRECQHCSILNHPNIVSFMGIYYPKESSTLPVIVMELMDESLRHYMDRLPKNTWMKKNSILIDVAEGLSYLHAQKPAVVHRDLSPNNILLKTGKGKVVIAKLADLGVAKIIEADRRATQSVLTTVPGTVDFMPPECFEDEPVYGVPLDVFSYGGIMLFVATHQWPTPTAQVGRNPKTNERVVRSEVERRQKYLDDMTGYAEWLKPLVESCLSDDPSERPIMSAVSKQLKESSFVLALQSGLFEFTLEKCADLPVPMYLPSAVLHNEKVYVMAGAAPDLDALDYVFTYNIPSNRWDRLPPPGHAFGVLEIIDGKLSVIGGVDTNTDEITKKVSTFINNSWTQHYPHMSTTRWRPGVASYSDYIIVAGGMRDINTDSINDDIELLYFKQSPYWIRTNINLPEPMFYISLTISNNLLYIVGYDTSRGWSNETYQIAVDNITSSVTQPAASSPSVDQWTTIPSTPHYRTAIVPYWCSPVIIGGDDVQGVPSADVAMLNESWSKVASLSSPRFGVAVVPINCEFIVIGGSTGGKTGEECKANSIITVEKGTFK